jgi:APA family basic amino acid/polyamine antiporter
MTASPDGAAGDDGAAQVSLRRSISLPWLLLYGLGTTVGAGIYALTGVVAGRAGMHMPAAFLLASGLALFTALSFAELSSRFPRAGGEAVYVQEAFTATWLFRLVGLLAVLSGVVSAATVTVGMVGYMREFAEVPATALVLVAALLLGGVAARGMRESVVVAGLITLVEVAGLLAIVGLGAGQLTALPDRFGEFVPGDLQALYAVSAAAVICFYAFLGFEDMVNVAEEVRDVRTVLPIGILATLALTALLYALVTTVSVLSVPPAELATSEAPLALVFARNGGSPALLGAIALLALLNGGLIQIVKSSRVLYGLAREGALPRSLGRVHPRTRTPLTATVLVTVVIAALAISFPIESLAESTAAVTLVTFTLTNLALVVIQRRGPAPPGALRVPRWVPVVGAFVSGVFLCIDLAQRVL